MDIEWTHAPLISTAVLTNANLFRMESLTDCNICPSISLNPSAPFK